MTDHTLQQLIDAYLEGDATQEQAAQLNEELRQPAALAEFVEQTHLHRQLHDALHAGEQQEGEVSRREMLWRYIDWRKHPAHFAVTALALTVVFWMAYGMLYWGTLNPLALGRRTPADDSVVPTEFVATLTRAHDAQWEVGQIGTISGAHLSAGHEMRLTRGTVEVAFKDGARVMLRGPAHFRIDGRDAGHLKTGLLLARVPQSAIGFRIDTPTATVIDLGTEFGIDATPAGGVGVFVTEGKVSVQPSVKDSAQRIVRKGESIRITQEGVESIEQPEADRTRGLLADMRLNELSISTAFGEGADVSLRGGNQRSKTFGQDPDMWLKSSVPDFNRVVVLRFDLAPIDRPIVSGVLEITMDTAYGEPPTSIVAAVFPHDAWSESHVSWQQFAELPGDEIFHLSSKFALVGELAVPRDGQQGTTLRLDDPRFVKFLNLRRGKTATIVLVAAPEERVLRLAAKEHTQLPPPTLHLKIADPNDRQE